MEKRISVNAEDLYADLCKIFQSAGLNEQDAAVVSGALIDAEASGVESHGVMRLGAYMDRLKSGLISACPRIEIQKSGIALQVDGGNGLGQVVMGRTVEKCIQTAKQYGAAVAAVRHSNHFGTAAYYANQIAQAGCIDLVATNAGATMAPFGGMDLLLGTNPFAVAFPARNQVFCADMATSAAAKGKIRIYEKQGKPIPLGWALDAGGNDTTDALAAVKGILLPMGGHKGYSLAMMVDALCGLLAGANLSCEAPSMFDTGRHSNVGHFVCAVDIAHFLPREEFEDRAQQWFDKLKSSKPRPGMVVMIPGEPEANRRVAAGNTLNILSETMSMVETYLAQV